MTGYNAGKENWEGGGRMEDTSHTPSRQGCLPTCFTSSRLVLRHVMKACAIFTRQDVGMRCEASGKGTLKISILKVL